MKLLPTRSCSRLAVSAPRRYDVAKVFASKFAWVSPVWLQLRANSAGSATVTGTHDIDASWVEAVRKACGRAALAATVAASAEDDAAAASPTARSPDDAATTAATAPDDQRDGPARRRALGAERYPARRPLAPCCPRIVPRVVWEAAQLSPAEMNRSATLLADLAERRGFDGLVMEMPVLPETTPWLELLAAELHRRSAPSGRRLALILVLPPAVADDVAGGGARQAGTPRRSLAALAAAGVDRFSVMTYDFSSGGRAVGPNAPWPWVRSTARRVIDAVAEGVEASEGFPGSLLEGAEARGGAGVAGAVARLRAAMAGGAAGDGGGTAAVGAGGDAAVADEAAEARRGLARAEAASRVLVGLAMYGHRSGEGGAPEAITGHTYVDLLREHRPKIQLDRAAREHFVRYGGAGRGRGKCFFPSLWSVSQRLRIAAAEGAGVALWEVGQGLDYWYDLL